MSASHSDLKIDENHTTDLMRKTKVPAVSIATFDIHGPTNAVVMKADKNAKSDVTIQSIFRVASLSKPVFSYLVLKLIDDNNTNIAKLKLGKFTLPNGVEKFDLDTPLHEVYPDILKKFDIADVEKAKMITARHVLSHQTGLPIKQMDDFPLKLQFEPGQEYGYSNPGFALLQEVIEKITDSHLQTLAKENVFTPFGMNSSSFCPPEQLKTTSQDEEKMASRPADMHAANSMHTTASDYGRFIAGWMRNETLWREATTKPKSIKYDKRAEREGLSSEDRKKIAWGLGLGLQLSSEGKVTGIFHSGDMNDWRAFVAVDFEKQKGIVFFTDAKNGLMLADSIVSPYVTLTDGLKYTFQKYGFARNIEDNWEKKEMVRVCKIIARNELDLVKLQEKKLLSIDENNGLRTLSIQCHPNNAVFNSAVKNEFDDFKETHQLEDRDDYKMETNTDKDRNILFLKINIFNSKLYHSFIDKLNAEKILPAAANAPQNTESASSYKSPTPLSRR